MNLTVLPDFLAIGGLVLAFRSLLKRTHQTRLHYWLVGWVLVLAHIFAQFVSQNVPVLAAPAQAFSLVMLLLTSVAFIWAGNDMRRQRGPRDLRTSMLSAIPDALLYVCLVYGVRDPVVYDVLCLAGLGASWWWLGGGRRHSDRFERNMRAAALVLVYAVQVLLLNLGRGDMALNWSLFWHYLAVAFFFRMGASQPGVGVRFTTLSFVAWALVFPVSVAINFLWPHVRVEHEVWNLPKFLVATGLIFTLLEEQMARAEHASLHDELTGLPNRRLFLRRLADAIRACRRRHGRLALLVIDLDGFKQVNDAHGHAIGDRLLQDVAERFSTCMRQEDTLVRMGGDEFAVILGNVRDREAAREVADKLRTSLGEPFEYEARLLQATASIGMSICPDDGEDDIRLYASADRDMYQHKPGVRPVVSAATPG